MNLIDHSSPSVGGK